MVMRVVFLGTPEFAVPSLKALLRSTETQVEAVITQPDRPSGRGQKLTPPPVKVFAEEQGIPVLQTERLRRDARIYDLLKTVDPELMVVVAFGQILPKDFFGYPKWGTINVHASLLPRYRGASPIVHAILNGETETGTTIMLIDEGMDTGDMLSRRAVPVPENMTAGELEPILAEDGARLLVETLPSYLAGALRPMPQDDSKATHAPRLEKDAGKIDWARPSRCLHDQIRAFNPWPGAFSTLRGQTVKVWRSARANQIHGGADSPNDRLPGEVLEVDREGIRVACGDSSPLVLTELQMPGRNRVSARDFANGLKLQGGEQFK